MPDFEIFDERFSRYVMGNAPVKLLATGFDWVEGPVWFGDMGCLLFSDIPNNRIMRWSPEGVAVYREPSNYANGHTRDRQGRLVSCEHGTRQVTRTEWDGSVTVIADNYRGKRLNSPNDVVVARDGSIWFTDPHYGIQTDYEGFRAEQELPCNVYRVGTDGVIDAVITDINGPNGLAFSPDEAVLYVSDTGRMFSDDERQILRFDVVDGRPRDGRPFHCVAVGAADGIRLDADGNLWSSGGDGVRCLSREGEVLGLVHVPETVSNLSFGGRAKHQLFITATTGLYRVVLNRIGAQFP